MAINERPSSRVREPSSKSGDIVQMHLLLSFSMMGRVGPRELGVAVRPASSLCVTSFQIGHAVDAAPTDSVIC